MKSYDELKELIDWRGVHAVFGSSGHNDFGIEQNAYELAQFLVVCQDLGIQSVLEIGTGYRAGLARFLHDDMGWAVTSVDIHDYGHRFEGITFIFDLIAGLEYPVFQDKFDLVILDGDHAYDAVRFDHDYYSQYATKVIAFHDIAGLRACEGVSRYWSEIAWIDQNEYKYKLKPGYYEIIAEGDQRGGIGYIALEQKQFAEELLTGSDLTPEQINPGYGKSPLEPVPRKPTTKKAPAKRTVKR